ncbi:hypothetical protein ACFFX0_27605 [Citricoccus parietis]|uniref:Uncharacterized protein n=1 Tax=Citricoccus parietis TaxID=592307 RepID=A0ABV5G784_9MICC
MISGIVVARCPRLCMVSASRATDPLSQTITICNSAVAPIPARLTHAARIPMELACSAVWIASEWSWLCGTMACLSRPQALR